MADDAPTRSWPTTNAPNQVTTATGTSTGRPAWRIGGRGQIDPHGRATLPTGRSERFAHSEAFDGTTSGDAKPRHSGAVSSRLG